jgi:A/G-specific adenine glycosylase
MEHATHAVDTRQGDAQDAGGTPQPDTVAVVTTAIVPAGSVPTHAPAGQVLVRDVLRWYAAHARDLPWRRSDVTPWEVMVSEFMLQQTPVERVRGPWQTWLERWPTPESLAAEPAGEAVRAWGRLGYPRRALRLHQAARVITDDFSGQVPTGREDLLRLPGVGSYTAAAIASFAYRRREIVLDTNVRRVIARLVLGQAQPGPVVSRTEQTVAEKLAPLAPSRAATWAMGSMELGALICTARAPKCADCPVRRHCAWRAAGYPASDVGPRRSQSYAGTDRQCRGALLAVLRSTDGPVGADELAEAWPLAGQRERALTSLIADGLVTRTATGWSLPH